jgi:predicted PhzF superfamily epimerase YddE/YHI9
MSEPRYKAGYMLAVEQITQLTADLATERARADALAIEHAELRAAIKIRIYDDGTWNVSVPPEHWQAVEAILAADPAQRGAEILAAAEALAAPLPSIPGQRLAACRICRATWPIGQPERHQDIEYGVPCPVVAYRRLRGRPAEG